MVVYEPTILSPGVSAFLAIRLSLQAKLTQACWHVQAVLRLAFATFQWRPGCAFQCGLVSERQGGRVPTRKSFEQRPSTEGTCRLREQFEAAPLLTLAESSRSCTNQLGSGNRTSPKISNPSKLRDGEATAHQSRLCVASAEVVAG